MNASNGALQETLQATPTQTTPTMIWPCIAVGEGESAPQTLTIYGSSTSFIRVNVCTWIGWRCNVTAACSLIGRSYRGFTCKGQNSSTCLWFQCLTHFYSRKASLSCSLLICKSLLHRNWLLSLVSHTWVSFNHLSFWLQTKLPLGDIQA